MLPLDWEILKSIVGPSSQKSIFYVDNDGNEILIDSNRKLFEAIKLSSINRKFLRLIVYDEDAKSREALSCHWSNFVKRADVNEYPEDTDIQLNNKKELEISDTVNEERSAKYPEVKTDSLSGVGQPKGHKFTQDEPEKQTGTKKIQINNAESSMSSPPFWFDCTGQPIIFDDFPSDDRVVHPAFKAPIIKNKGQPVTFDTLLKEYLENHPEAEIDHDGFPSGETGKQPETKRIQMSSAENLKHSFTISPVDTTTGKGEFFTNDSSKLPKIVAVNDNISCFTGIFVRDLHTDSEPKVGDKEQPGQPKTITLQTCKTGDPSQNKTLYPGNSIRCSKPAVQVKNTGQFGGLDGYSSSDTGRQSEFMFVSLDDVEKAEGKIISGEIFEKKKNNKDGCSMNTNVVGGTDASQGAAADSFSHMEKSTLWESVSQNGSHTINVPKTGSNHSAASDLPFLNMFQPSYKDVIIQKFKEITETLKHRNKSEKEVEDISSVLGPPQINISFPKSGTKSTGNEIKGGCEFITPTGQKLSDTNNQPQASSSSVPEITVKSCIKQVNMILKTRNLPQGSVLVLRNGKVLVQDNRKEKVLPSPTVEKPESKCKKDVLELKSDLHNIIRSAIKEEVKSARKKLQIKDFLTEKIKVSTSVGGKSKEKKKKKKKKKNTGDSSMKNIVEIKEQGDEKPSKRLKKLQSIKSECLEKLDKTKVLLEEKRKLLEKKPNSKSKLDNSSLEEKNVSMTSAAFCQNNGALSLPPDSEFSVFINIINDGKVRWSTPRLECFYARDIIPKETTINLPRLFPNESCLTMIKGKTSPDAAGLYCLKFRFVDGQEKLNRQFTCYVKVEATKPVLGDVESFPVDLEGDFFSSSEKKIKENIYEIEKKLRDIDLLRPACSEQTKNEGIKKKKNKRTGESVGLKPEGKTLAETLEKDATQSGYDCVMFADPYEKDSGQGKKQKNKKEDESESHSDSELSVISMSKDEYLIVESFSDTESLSEGVSEEKSPKSEANDKTSTSNEQQEPFPEEPAKIERESSIQDLSFFIAEEVMQSPARSRPSPLGEGISKPKKMKSKSTEYRFTTANLIQPIFSSVPNPAVEKKFTFTGEKEEKPKMEEDREERDIPKTDSSGRVIYAVNRKGVCSPVTDLLDETEKWKNLSEEEKLSTTCEKEEENQTQPEKQSERPNDPPTVNILPNALVNSATNVASLAFNTAKSVINNLQSAFATEGKTEAGKSPCDSKVNMENMYKLYEMGFHDIQTNRQLLLQCKNDLSEVIEMLVNVDKTPSDNE